jgi:hypothetical protein
VRVIPLYDESEGFKEQVHIGWYSCGGDVAIAIVAVENPGLDWAAYIGAQDDVYTMNISSHETARCAAHYGEKLPREMALALFPELAGSGLRYRT